MADGRTPRLPQELIDLIIDLIHTDRPTLKSCVLLRRSTTHPCRRYLFRKISLRVLEYSIVRGVQRMQDFSRFWRAARHLLPYVEEIYVDVPLSMTGALADVLVPFADHPFKRVSFESPISLAVDSPLPKTHPYPHPYPHPYTQTRTHAQTHAHAHAHAHAQTLFAQLMASSRLTLTHLKMGDVRDVPWNFFARFERLATLVIVSDLQFVEQRPWTTGQMLAAVFGNNLANAGAGAGAAASPPSDADEDEGQHSLEREGEEVEGEGEEEEEGEEEQEEQEQEREQEGSTKVVLSGLHIFSDSHRTILGPLMDPKSNLDLRQLKHLSILSDPSITSDPTLHPEFFQKVGQNIEYLSYDPPLLTLFGLLPCGLDLALMPRLRKLTLTLRLHHGGLQTAPFLESLLAPLPPTNTIRDLTFCITIVDSIDEEEMARQGWAQLDAVLARWEVLHRVRFVCLSADFHYAVALMTPCFETLKARGVLVFKSVVDNRFQSFKASFEDFDVCRDGWD